MDETSSFYNNHDADYLSIEDDNGKAVEQLYLSGSTCDTFVVRIMGKLHFKKKLKAKYCGIAKYEEAFRKEFETGFRLEHPSLTRYVSYNEENGCPYILEEYIEGETLKQFLHESPDYFHNRHNADTFIDELLSVMAYLHKHQVLYLDLKPDNVMITSFGHHLRLVDLGGCRTDAFVDTKSHTEEFAAPEQSTAKTSILNFPIVNRLDQRTDIYLIGRLLQYVNLPHIYNKVVARCLRKNPEERYQTVAELNNAVAKARKMPIQLTIAIIALACCLASLIVFVAPKIGQKSESRQTVLATSHLADTTHVTNNTAVTPVTNIGSHATSNSATKYNAEVTAGQGGASEMQQMTRELHSEMDKAFDRYLGTIANDSTLDAITFSRHINRYNEALKEIETRIDKRYPNVAPATIHFEIEKYISQTVTPLMQRLVR